MAERSRIIRLKTFQKLLITCAIRSDVEIHYQDKETFLSQKFFVYKNRIIREFQGLRNLCLVTEQSEAWSRKKPY